MALTVTTEVVLGGSALLTRYFNALGQLVSEDLQTLPTLGAPKGGAAPVEPIIAPESNRQTVSTGEALPTIPSAPPGARVFEVTVKDGIRSLAGDAKPFSTGPVAPSKITGWTAPDNVKVLDDVYASTTSPATGYCAELVATGFDFNLPEGAVITGIKVVVARRKL